MGSEKSIRDSPDIVKRQKEDQKASQQRQGRQEQGKNGEGTQATRHKRRLDSAKTENLRKFLKQEKVSRKCPELAHRQAPHSRTGKRSPLHALPKHWTVQMGLHFRTHQAIVPPRRDPGCRHQAPPPDLRRTISFRPRAGSAQL
mgnify:CR=1 FL=1